MTASQDPWGQEHDALVARTLPSKPWVILGFDTNADLDTFLAEVRSRTPPPSRVVAINRTQEKPPP